MAYNDYLFAKPDGADNGPTVVTTTKRNLLATLHAAVMGLGIGWLFSAVNGTGTALKPQYWFLKSAANEVWIRFTLTWGTTGGQNGNVTAFVIEWSGNSGVAWESMASGSITYDSFGNPTATSGGGGLTIIMLSLIGRWWRLYDAFTLHELDGSAHGMNDMAIQQSNAVDISGGLILSTTQQLTRNALGVKNAAFDIDLHLGHFHTFTVQAGAVASFINIPAAGIVHPVTLRITNGGLVAFATLFPGTKTKPGGVNPTLSTAGTDDVFGYFQDGSTFEITGTSLAKA